MRTTTTAFDLLYITDEAGDPEEVAQRLGIEDGSVNLATTVQEALTALPDVDCILCADQVDGQWCLNVVRTLRNEHPAVPVVVFTGDSDQTFVDKVLRSGATDVVQSTVDEASPSLVQTRIEGVLSEGSVRSGRGRAVQRYETILNTAADAIYHLDTDGKIVAANDAATELTGYDRADLVGAHVSKFMSEDDIEDGEQIIREQLRSENWEIRSLEMDIQTASGETVPCEARIRVLTADGEFAGSVGVVRDITEKLEREQELRDRDELLRHIGQNVTDVVWVTTPDKDTMEFINAAYEDIWGRSREQLYEDPNSFVEGVHPDDRERVRKALVRQQVDPESYDETYRVMQPDGEVRWVHDRAFSVYENGELTRIIGVAQDITDRKAAQQQLEAERDTFAQGPAVVFEWENAEGWPVEYVSENVEELLGYTPEQFQSGEIPYADLIHEDDIERVREEVRENSDETTERFSHEPYRVVTSEGGIRWVKDTTKIIRERGEITHYLGYLVDITERKEREQELRDLKEEYELIMDTVSDVVYTLDEDYYFMSVNGAAEELTGYTREELEGSHLSVLLSDAAIEHGLEHRQKVIDGELETGSIEVEINRKDGSTCPAEFRYRLLPCESGEFRGTAGIIRDITERKQREEKIERQRDELAQLDRLNEVIRDVDQALVGATSREEIEQAVCERLTESGRYKFALALRATPAGELELRAWTDVGAEYAQETFPITDVGPENSPGLRAFETGEVQAVENIDTLQPDVEWEANAQRNGIKSLAAIPVSYEDKSYGVVAVYNETDEEFSERELEVLGELGETVGYAIAAVERREREQTLTSLYEATQELLGVESQQGVAEVVVDAAQEVLDLSGVGVFLFDETNNTLKPVAATDKLLDFYGESTAFGPGRTESETWQSYVTGEQQFFEDIRESERVANPETDARATLIIPLGDHGVFVAASTDIGAFDDSKQRLVGLLAATTEAALDRVTGQADIRERDAELAAQVERVQQLERIIGFVRDANTLLVNAGTREELERGICKRLTKMEPYTFAWIGTVPPDGSSVEPQTWHGDGNGYLDTVSLDVEGDEPAARAARDESTAVVPNVGDHLRDSEWARAAADCGFQSVAAVPLVYGETTYGVLTVYATQPNVFDETVTSVLAELGELVAYSINTIETRRGVLSEHLTELELNIETPDAFLSAVARVAGEPVSYREILPEGSGSATVLFALANAPVEEILALESEFVSVDSLSQVDRGDEHLFRASLNGQTIATTLLKCGGIPNDIVAGPDETRVVVRLPQELDVRVFLNRVEDTYPNTELLSRRSVDRQSQDSVSIRTTLEESLTERQREVLQTAFESGFFESPRETTGAELASLLGISQPTVTHHLREAQRRLFATLYSDEG